VITGDELSRVLHAIATGYVDRALNLILSTENLDENERVLLSAALTEHKEPAVQARALGDAFLKAGADQTHVNEAYRTAFYVGDDWAEMAENPLYAHFTANKSGAVLDKWIHYFPIYTNHLAAYRGKPVKVLEIGVYRGGGLHMLSRYLGPQAQLVGLDVDEAAVRAVRGRFPVVLGDQEDPGVLEAINRDYGPFDIIIDDGGHTMGQQIVSVETLYPLLNDGGVYIVEDCHTSYWPSMGGGLRADGTFLEWAKDRIDDLHSRHSTDIDHDTIWATDVAGMHVYDSVVVFDKRHRFRAFNEVVGSSSYLFADRFSEAVGIELLATRDAAIAERDALLGGLVASDAAGEAQLVRAELARTRDSLAELDGKYTETIKELQRTQSDLLESWEQVKNMRRTVSWRVTAPLRAARRTRGR
jgi:hypothetical protein